ncbi:MAG: hypothetical protein KAT65_17900, partial [Methanophagales archaeon]|nr:hypothetical protein [Methanophagales archaeon]
MNVNIKHLALGISVAVVLLCVFAGVDNATSGDYFSAYPKQFVRLSPNLGSISDHLTYNYPDVSVSNGWVRKTFEPSRCVNVRNPINKLSILPTLQHVSTESPPYFNFHPKNIESIDAPIFMGQNDIGTRGKSFNTNSNPIDVENKACVHINKMYAVGTLEDYLVTGNYHAHHWFGVNVENMYDITHDNIMLPTNVSMSSPNILYFWEEYLSSNTSDTGYWQYPNIIPEDEEHSIAGIRVPDENAFFDFEIGRSINETFYSNDYRNGSFSVIFHNLTGVSWIPCRIGAYNTSEVSVTLLHHTFTSNVPLEDIENGSNYIDFTLDKSAVQEDEQYNFSIQYYVELHSPPSIIFKPEFAVHYETGDYGPYEYSHDGNSIYLNSSYCPNPLQAVVVNVTQDLSWYRAKHLHYEEHLYEVSGLVGPHAEFHFNKDFNVWTRNDSITSGT